MYVVHQEEKELTDLEVSLHRTKALLGEKIIRLRHLEQSIDRAATIHTHHTHDTSATTNTDSSGFSGSDLDFSNSQFSTFRYLFVKIPVLLRVEASISLFNKLWINKKTIDLKDPVTFDKVLLSKVYLLTLACFFLYVCFDCG